MSASAAGVEPGGVVTPAERGAMYSRITREEKASVTVPSSPYPTSIRSFRSFDEDEEDQTVVVLLLPHLPLLAQRDREVLDRLAFERGKDVDDELRAALLLEVAQLPVEQPRGPSEQPGLVGEPPRRRRRKVERGEGGGEAAAGEPPGEGQVAGEHRVPAGGVSGT